VSGAPEQKSEFGEQMMNYAIFGILALCGIIALITVLGSFFSVRTQTAAIIERFGKFSRVAEPGLNFKTPFIETQTSVSLVTYQLEGSIETKTKDNVFVQLPVKVQYRVIDNPQAIRDAYYKLSNPTSQIEAYLYNILLGHIPETTLDEIFLTQPAIAQRATLELSAEMKDFGYEIVKVLITDIIPDQGVKVAMNRINEQTRLAVANQAQGDAEYILKVRRAQADAEVKRLEGVGVAQEREAIAEGWEKSITTVKENTNLNDESAAFILLFTNWTDMMSKVGSSPNSTMVFMPSGPEGLQNFQATMTNALLARQPK
jgi:regulator of protease activity HflC (stomatin/prohibitin superfamily)